MRRTISEKSLLQTHHHSGWVGEHGQLTDKQLAVLFALLTAKDNKQNEYFATLLNLQFARIIALTRKLDETLPHGKNGAPIKAITMVAKEVGALCKALSALQDRIGALHELTEDYIDDASSLNPVLPHNPLQALSDLSWELQITLCYDLLQSKPGGSKTLAIDTMERLYGLYEGVTGTSPGIIPYLGNTGCYANPPIRQFIETFLGFLPDDVLESLKLQRNNMASLINEAIKSLKGTAQTA